VTEASTAPPSRGPLPSRLVWRAGLVAAVAATLVNVVAWLVVQQLLDAGLQIPEQPGGAELQPLPLGPVVFATFGTALAAVVLLWLLTRSGPAGVRVWTILAVAFGLLTCFAPFSLDVSLGEQLGLLLFHVLALVTLVAVVRQQLAGAR
jgi:Family of unknown function (DUF6069)